MLVETLRGAALRGWTLGVFRHGVAARFLRPRQRRHWGSLRHRRRCALGHRCRTLLDRTRGGLVLTAAEADRSQTLEQRHFRLVPAGGGLPSLALTGADLVLRRDRPLIDTRHARPAPRPPFPPAPP